MNALLKKFVKESVDQELESTVFRNDRFSSILVPSMQKNGKLVVSILPTINTIKWKIGTNLVVLKSKSMGLNDLEFGETYKKNVIDYLRKMKGHEEKIKAKTAYALKQYAHLISLKVPSHFSSIEKQIRSDLDKHGEIPGYLVLVGDQFKLGWLSKYDLNILNTYLKTSDLK